MSSADARAPSTNHVENSSTAAGAGTSPPPRISAKEPVDLARRERLRERSAPEREVREAPVARDQQELRALLLRPGEEDDADILVALAVDAEDLVDRKLANLRDKR
jgi:hypothetical protein